MSEYKSGDRVTLIAYNEARYKSGPPINQDMLDAFGARRVITLEDFSSGALYGNTWLTSGWRDHLRYYIVESWIAKKKLLPKIGGVYLLKDQNLKAEVVGPSDRVDPQKDRIWIMRLLEGPRQGVERNSHTGNLLPAEDIPIPIIKLRSTIRFIRGSGIK